IARCRRSRRGKTRGIVADEKIGALRSGKPSQLWIHAAFSRFRDVPNVPERVWQTLKHSRSYSTPVAPERGFGGRGTPGDRSPSPVAVFEECLVVRPFFLITLREHNSNVVPCLKKRIGLFDHSR